MPEAVEEKLLRQVTAVLEELDIPYGVTGGFAVVVWGRPRFTADIDIVVALKPEKVKKLAQELLKTDAHGYIDEDTAQEAIRKKGSFNFIHPTSGLKIDFMVIGSEPYDLEQIKRRVAKDFAGQTIFFISPEDLILNKLLWYKKGESTRQLEDIESIIKIQKKLDWKYVEKWAKIQSTFDTLEQLNWKGGGDDG